MDLCGEEGLPFRGGGEDTFRNILTSTLTGLRRESVFDIIPYADELEKYIFTVDKAFELPRKIKIGLFDAPRTNTLPECRISASSPCEERLRKRVQGMGRRRNRTQQRRRRASVRFHSRAGSRQSGQSHD